MAIAGTCATAEPALVSSARPRVAGGPSHADGSPMSLISTLQPTGEGARAEKWTGIRVGDKSPSDAPPILRRRKSRRGADAPAESPRG